jgi:serine/threonine protein kinase
MSEPEKIMSDATEETRRLSRPKGLEVGQTVAEFRIVRELGRGGMGVVYLAHDQKLDRDVALKLLLDVPQLGPEYEARFLREARNAARLDHPNVVQVYSAGRAGDVSYIAMQFVKGTTLDVLLHERGPFEATEALRIIGDVCRALSAAHELGIVHRDIKPSNIMIEENDRVKVMDFGLSRGIAGCGMERVTQSGIFLGTPEYSSPEQCETNEMDGRSDIYSLGVVLYEMLSGRTPHSAPTPLSLFKKIMEEVPQPIGSLVPALAKSVCTLVETMMTKDKNSRYATAAHVASDIKKILAGQSPVSRDMDPDAARTTQLDGSVRAHAESRRRRVALVACLVLVIASASVIVLMNFFRGGSRQVARTPQPGQATPVLISKGPSTASLTWPRSMVVFDFRNTTGSKEHEWMELGIPEILISEMNQAGFLRVVTRDELLLKMHEIAGRKIIVGDCVSSGPAERLLLTPETQRLLTCFSAQLIVCGSFLVQGDKVKIIADIYTRGKDDGDTVPTETASGRAARARARITHLAARDEQGPVADVFLLVDKLAQALSEAIRRELPPVHGEAAVTAMKVAEDKPMAKHDAEKVLEPVPAPLEFLGKTIGHRSRRDKLVKEKQGRTGEPATAAKDEISTGAGKAAEPDTREIKVGAGEKVAEVDVMLVEQPKEDNRLSGESLALKCEVALRELKKLSNKDIFEIARLRWRMQKLVEDSEAQESPEV